jgi:hypothetical protein
MCSKFCPFQEIALCLLLLFGIFFFRPFVRVFVWIILCSCPGVVCLTKDLEQTATEHRTIQTNSRTKGRKYENAK